jgi:hypothetical protein
MPQSWYGRFGEDKNVLSQLGFELRIFQLVTYLRGLSKKYPTIFFPAVSNDERVGKLSVVVLCCKTIMFRIQSNAIYFLRKELFVLIKWRWTFSVVVVTCPQMPRPVSLVCLGRSKYIEIKTHVAANLHSVQSMSITYDVNNSRNSPSQCFRNLFCSRTPFGFEK